MNLIYNIFPDYTFNSLAPGRPGCHFKNTIFNHVLLIGFFRSANDDAPRWMPWNLTDDKSTLVQVMAWCCQATSHYLSQCWPSSMLPYGVARPQWVNTIRTSGRNQWVKLWCWHHKSLKYVILLWSFMWALHHPWQLTRDVLHREKTESTN